MSKMAKSSEEVRIAVVDDHPIVQQALASLLAHTEGWTLCGQAASAAKVMAAAVVVSAEMSVIVLLMF